MGKRKAGAVKPAFGDQDPFPGPGRMLERVTVNSTHPGPGMLHRHPLGKVQRERDRERERERERESGFGRKNF